VAGAQEPIAAARRAQSVSFEIFVENRGTTAGIRRRRAGFKKEGRAPGRGVDVAQVKPVALPVHASHHVADAAPAVERAVEHLEFGRARLKASEPESRNEQTTPLVKHRQAGLRRVAAAKSRSRGRGDLARLRLVDT